MLANLNFLESEGIFCLSVECLKRLQILRERIDTLTNHFCMYMCSSVMLILILINHSSMCLVVIEHSILFLAFINQVCIHCLLVITWVAGT